MSERTEQVKQPYKFSIGEPVICVNDQVLVGNEIGPPVTLYAHYDRINDIFVDSKGNQHLDVGIKSTIEFVTSYETGEKLPHSDKIWWCHPSRFIPNFHPKSTGA